jgi:hypothetical protein
MLIRFEITHMKLLIKLTLSLAGIVPFAALQAAVLPYGSVLEIRLLHKLSSRESHLGDPVEASLITPYFDHDRLLLPAGVMVLGRIERIERLGMGLRHTEARLDVHFTELRLTDGSLVPFDAHVASVETARESVRTDGTIVGINPTANFSTGVSALFTLSNLAEREFRLPILGFKFLAARSPDAEIGFPAGTEMLLRVTRNTEIDSVVNKNSDVPLLSAAQITDVQAVLAGIPEQQTDRGNNRPSDLVNIMILGDRDQVVRSFHAAGWTVPESHGVLALYHMFHCAVERKGNSRLPMSNLRLNGNIPDAAFEKSLDTFAKRHHIRLWYDENAHAWLGAATEDVSYKWSHTHITHATDGSIDNERAKVVNDLAFTGCVDRGALIPRAALKPAQTPGSSIHTDGDIAVMQLNRCDAPHGMPTDPQKPVQVRAIRMAIAVGVDLARSNPVSVVYALTKSILEAGTVRDIARLQAARIYTRPSAISNASAGTADGALAVR